MKQQLDLLNSTIDEYSRTVRTIVDNNPNMLVPHYLSAGYIYYVLDDNIITDSCYDYLTVQLKGKWETITHRHKEYVDYAGLVSGSGFAIDWEGLPTITISSAIGLLIKIRG